jgi:hypothetical protein
VGKKKMEEGRSRIFQKKPNELLFALREAQ